MISPHSPSQNHLLAALPTAEFEALAAHLELVPMRLGQMLYEPGEQLQHAYFPTTSIVSLHYVMESGASAETAGVGNEGMLGVSLFMGGDTTPSSAVVQTAGHAYRFDGKPGPWRCCCRRQRQQYFAERCRWTRCRGDVDGGRRICFREFASRYRKR
jgi:hypothetical protein